MNTEKGSRGMDVNRLLYGNKIHVGTVQGKPVYENHRVPRSITTGYRFNDVYYQNDNNDYHTRDGTSELERERVRREEERMRREATERALEAVERALRTEQQRNIDIDRELKQTGRELASARSLIRDQQEKWWVNEPAIYIPWRYDQWLEAVEGGV